MLNKGFFCELPNKNINSEFSIVTLETDNVLLIVRCFHYVTIPKRNRPFSVLVCALFLLY